MLTSKSKNKSNAAQNVENPPASSWAQWFERCAQQYNDPRMKMAYYQDGQTGKPISQKTMTAIYRDVLNKLSVTKDSTILDVGCGVGMFSQALRHHVQKIIGSDISGAMIQDAYQMNPQGTFLVCDAGTLPFSSSSFDRVLCYSVFHYLKDLICVRNVLNEFVRVVKKNGLILVGDILKPMACDHTIKKNSKENTPPSAWWPSNLNHHLKKLTIDPNFFIDYSRASGYRCAILSQMITGKTTAASRYDVVIRFPADEK